MATIEELRAKALEIKNETKEGANTASRIGGFFVSVADNLETYENEALESFQTTFTANEEARDAKVDEKVEDITELQEAISIIEKKTELLDITYEHGWMYGTGNKPSSSSTSTKSIIFSDKLYGKGLYLIIIPDELYCTCNFLRNDGERSNAEFYSPFSLRITEDSDFVNAYFKRKDGNNLSPEDDIVSSIKVYRVNSFSFDYDVVIAAKDTLSTHKEKADIVCDGSNDTDILAAVFGCVDGVKVKLLDGTFVINKFFTYGTERIAIPLSVCSIERPYVLGPRLIVDVDGWVMATTYNRGDTRLRIDEETHNTIDTANYSYKVIGKYDSANHLTNQYNFKNFTIFGWYYDKPIIFIDLHNTLNANLEGVNVMGCRYVTPKAFDIVPPEGLIGIRVGRGSNYGIQNYIRHCHVWYFHTGISCCGEHFIFEDILTHHDYIAWAFGDLAGTGGHFEHPNIMLGCSIEQCYRLMVLTKEGETIEGDFVRDSTKYPSTLICIGCSTELVWTLPGTSDTQATLPILEVLKGAYCGRIEIDYSGSPFEDGSGSLMYFSTYFGSNTWTGHGNTITEHLYK